MVNRKRTNKKQKKRKVVTKVDAAKTGLVQGGIAVKSAIKTASETHTKQKKANDTYQSIFSAPEEKKQFLELRYWSLPEMMQI